MTTTDIPLAPSDTKRDSFNDRFISHVRAIALRDRGIRARLRRSVRSDGTPTADAYWLLGGLLPDDRDRALAMAQTAAWCATHSSGEQRNSDMWWMRSIGGQLGREDSKAAESTAERMLELATRDGLSMAQRLKYIDRSLAVITAPEVIDWARLLADISQLHQGGEPARRTRTRWYRAYHQSNPLNETSGKATQ